MSNNPAKYEVLIKHLILAISAITSKNLFRLIVFFVDLKRFPHCSYPPHPSQSGNVKLIAASTTIYFCHSLQEEWGKAKGNWTERKAGKLKNHKYQIPVWSNQKCQQHLTLFVIVSSTSQIYPTEKKPMEKKSPRIFRSLRGSDLFKSYPLISCTSEQREVLREMIEIVYGDYRREKLIVFCHKMYLILIYP